MMFWESVRMLIQLVGGKLGINTVLLTLFTQYAVSESKPQGNPTREKKEDNVAHRSQPRETFDSHLGEKPVTNAPENILNTPTTTSQNPIFGGQYGDYYHYNYDTKSSLLNYKSGSVDDGSYIPQVYSLNEGKFYQNNPQLNSNYGKNVKTGYLGYQYNPVNYNQGKYFNNNNYGAYGYTPGYYNDGRYQFSAYNYSSYGNINPQYSGIHYPYQYPAYQPTSSGHYSGNEAYFKGGYNNNGVSYKESSSKVDSGSSSSSSGILNGAAGNVEGRKFGAYKTGYQHNFQSYPGYSSKVGFGSSLQNSGVLSGTSGNTGAGNFGAYRTGYQNGFSSYPGYFNTQYKSNSYANYNSPKHNGYQLGQLHNYYDQGYYEIGKGAPVQSTYYYSPSAYQSGYAGTGGVSSQGQFEKTSYPYRHPLYLNYGGLSQNTAGYSSYSSQSNDYSKVSHDTYEKKPPINVYSAGIPKTTSVSPLGISSAFGSAARVSSSGNLDSKEEIKSFEKVKTGAYGKDKVAFPIGTSTVSTSPALTRTYDYNVYKQHPGYYFSNSNKGHSIFGSGVTSTPATSTFSSLSQSKNPSVIPSTIYSTAIPTTTSSTRGGTFQSTLNRNYQPLLQYSGFQSGYFGSKAPKKVYDTATNQYTANNFYQNTDETDEGIKYPASVFSGTVPTTSSGISSSLNSNLEPNPFAGVTETSTTITANTPSFSSSYDFSGYGAKIPATFPTVSTTNPSYYNYPTFQPLYNTYTYGSNQNSPYSYYPDQSGLYYESSYRSLPYIPQNFTNSILTNNQNLGSFTSDGRYNPSYSGGLQYHGYSSSQSGIYPGYYSTGNYYGGISGNYQHPGSISWKRDYYASANGTSENPVAYSSTRSSVTSTQKTKVD